MRSLFVAAGLIVAGTASSQTLTCKEVSEQMTALRIFGMAYDPVNHGVLVFGGYPESALTWLWDGHAWTQLAPATSPPGRNFAVLCNDLSRSVVVLFGGAAGANGPLGDTWEWDGTTWQQRSPLHSPSARYSHAMAYDSARSSALLFGGWDTARLDDTWEWDGSDWTELAPQTRPPARSAHAMACDSDRNRVVLFGGRDDAGLLADTWEWDGTNWLERSTNLYPAPRAAHAMAFDPIRKRTVLTCGSTTGGYYSDTWEWDGDSWLHPGILGSPPARSAHGMSYYPDRRLIVLLGGYSLVDFHDTWHLFTAFPADYSVFGSGCQGTAGTPSLSAVNASLPWVGETLNVRLDSLPNSLLAQAFGILGFSDKLWGSIPLPLNLEVIGMPTCLLHVSIDQVFPLNNTSGNATWSFLIPEDASLAGAEFFQQGFVLDFGANPLGATVTNPARAVVGVR